jgi:hypothetical protein
MLKANWGVRLLYAIDLLEFDGEDQRREPLETCAKATLASLLCEGRPGALETSTLSTTTARSSAAMPAC